MLTVKDAFGILNDHHIGCSEQMLRRWLRQGRLKGTRSENRKEGWRICEIELYRFMESLQWEGTAYEEGIDAATKIKRLLEEITELKLQIEVLEKKNEELNAKLGIPPF